MPRKRYRKRFTTADLVRIAEAHGTACVRGCGRPVDLELPRSGPMGATVDHYPIPWADGGTDALENLRLAHSACNKAAGRRPVTDLGPQSRDWYA